MHCCWHCSIWWPELHWRTNSQQTREYASTLRSTRRHWKWLFTLLYDNYLLAVCHSSRHSCRWLFSPTITTITTIASSQVQSGGSFDIDYVVTSPTLRVVLDGSKERQGDFVFTANEIGDYKFCLSNDMSTFAEKLVDLEIAVSTRLTNPPSPGSPLLLAFFTAPFLHYDSDS